MQLTTTDSSVIVLFILLSLYLGIRYGRSKGKGAISYLLADKNVTLPVFVMTNVATWYGGILGVGEFTYQYGLLNWFTQGLPYYLFAIAYAFLLVKKIKIQGAVTIPELIGKTYGPFNQLFASLLIFLLTSPAPYILMNALILVHVFNISLPLAAIISCVITIVYLYKGGYKADLITDIYFFLVMFIGFGLVLMFLFYTYGGFSFLVANLPETHLQVTGGAGFGYILVWYLIAIWTFADPGFYQRVQSAKDANVAKWGILISVVLWFVFDLLTNGIGLYSKALMPDLKMAADAYLNLADGFLPAGLRGIFYIGLFATILSTLNSFYFLSSITLAQGIIIPIMNDLGINKKTPENESTVFYTRVSLIITGIVSVLLAISFPSVIGLWYIIGSICIPPIILILLSVFFPLFRVSTALALIESVLVFVAGIIWWFLRTNGFIHTSLEVIEPMVFALAIAILLHCTFIAISNKNSVKK